jgi:hypothetical protein
VIIERRVIMLSRGARLGTVAVRALGLGRSVACLESPADLDDWASPPVDVVLLDFPRRHRGIVYRQLRQRYRGPVLALLDPGDDGGGLPSNRGPLAILHRPFSGEELTEVLGTLLEPSDDDLTAPAVVGAFEPAPATPPAPPSPPEATADPAPAPAPAPDPAPDPGPQVLMTGEPADDGEDWAPPSRWEALARFGVRRWQVVLAGVAIALLGLSFGAPSQCRSGCHQVAGAADGTLIGGGALLDPVTGTSSPGLKGATASSTGSSAVPGAPPSVTSVIGGLISTLGGGASPPSLLGPLGTSGPIPVAGAVPPPTAAPTTTRAPTTTTRAATTTTKAPTTTTKPPATTAPPTTAAPTTAPPTTAPPTTAPPTTAPPTTEPPTTV